MKITCQGSSRQIAEGIVDLSCSASWSVWIASRLAEAAAGTAPAPGASKITGLPKLARVSFTLMLWLQVTKELTHIYFYLPFLLPFDTHLFLSSPFQGPEPQARAGADVQEGVAVPMPGFGHVALQEGTICWKGKRSLLWPAVVSWHGTFSMLERIEHSLSQYLFLNYCVYITQCLQGLLVVVGHSELLILCHGSWVFWGVLRISYRRSNLILFSFS